MPLYGLVGYPLGHSFSQKYFTDKFAIEKLNDCFYQNFEIKNIAELKNIVSEHTSLQGLNVTIPYKTSAMPLLDELDATAASINSINTITIVNKKLTGYNTDCIGFEKSLKNFIGNKKIGALILGTGGSAKAVAFVLRKMQLDYLFVSRFMSKNKSITYSQLTPILLLQHKLIINCTPLGKFPDQDTFPPLDYSLLTAEHFLFDLNYNPEQTVFMLRGIERNATVQNGYQMLTIQAEASWKIWNGK